jgi:acyl-CoA synthetase (AMP-forming)/AMP-acid ligase II
MLLDPLLPKERIQEILNRLPPDALFTASETHFDLDGERFQIECTEDLDILVSQSTPTSHQVETSKPFMVAFTSGTTSTPKAFARDRASWQRSLERGRPHFAMNADLATLSPGPLVHGLSLYAFAETLEAGATFYTMEKFDAQEAARMVENSAIKRLVCVPTMLEGISRTGADFSSLTHITTAGAKLNSDLLAKTQNFAQNAKVTEYYGASELGFVSSVTHPANHAQDLGVGTAFPELDIEIRNPDAAGNGEIWVQSDLTIQGYLWQDDVRGFRRADGWSTVGDIGRLIDGNLHLKARAGGMVTTGGNNVYLDEIAAHMDTHPKITHCEILGLPDDYLGTKIIAVIEFSKKQPSLRDLLDYCGQGLQKYKIPRDIYSISSWPMTTSGKISTGQLETWLKEKDPRLAPL